MHLVQLLWSKMWVDLLSLLFIDVEKSQKYLVASEKLSAFNRILQMVAIFKLELCKRVVLLKCVWWINWVGGCKGACSASSSPKFYFTSEIYLESLSVIFKQPKGTWICRWSWSVTRSKPILHRCSYLGSRQWVKKKPIKWWKNVMKISSCSNLLCWLVDLSLL